MNRLTIALLQMTAQGADQAANLAKGADFCRRAKGMDAAIALFPEMWNIGYSSFCAESHADLWRFPEHWPDSREMAEDPALVEAKRTWQAQAIGLDDPFVVHFRDLARELDMAIALTYLERWPRAPRNTVSLIDRHGEMALTYAKVHTCDFDYPEAALTPGNDFPVCRLDTTAGEVMTGAMICYDREFPETARILMLNGAEIILVPNACPMETNRLGQFRARAAENMVGVALTNYAAPQQNGHSVAYDPIAFDRDGNSRDTLIVEAGEQEGIYLAEFDLDTLRDYRRRETWGNAFRRPHLYGALIAPGISPPFVRTNSTGDQYDPTKR